MKDGGCRKSWEEDGGDSGLETVAKQECVLGLCGYCL